MAGRTSGKEARPIRFDPKELYDCGRTEGDVVTWWLKNLTFSDPLNYSTPERGACTKYLSFLDPGYLRCILYSRSLLLIEITLPEDETRRSDG